MSARSMRRVSILALAFLLLAPAALAGALRSGQHLVTIDAQPVTGGSRRYAVQVFDAGTRSPVAHMIVLTKGDAAAEAETTSGGIRYTMRVLPHGEAYLVEFSANDGTGVIDTMRGGFTNAATPRPSAARPMRAGREIEEPAVVRRVEPVTTAEGRAAGVAGAVVVEATIDRGGFVRDVRLVQGLGYGLDEAAMDAVRQWRFAPSMDEREPVEVVQEVVLQFTTGQ